MSGGTERRRCTDLITHLIMSTSTSMTVKVPGGQVLTLPEAFVCGGLAGCAAVTVCEAHRSRPFGLRILTALLDRSVQLTFPK